MPIKPSLLIVTTAKDTSAALFTRPEVTALVDVEVVLYDTSFDRLDIVLQTNFNCVYFRDPFNDQRLQQQIAQNATTYILEHTPNAYHVDHINDYEDMLFEDKWLQYQALTDIMPATRLLPSTGMVDFDKEFVKKRISSRSNGIILSKDDFETNVSPREYIAQTKLRIITEYRVCIIGGVVVSPLLVKSSKSNVTKAKVTGSVHEVDPEIKTMCNTVYAVRPYDFMGLDIAYTAKGYYLIEVNRSCQFAAYLRVASDNLAVGVVQHLLALNGLTK